MKRLLILLNVVCATMHILFEIYIYNKSIEYKGFISVENTLIIFVFIALAIFLWIQKKKEGFLLNFFFWGIFEICIIVFRPSKTTLEIFHSYINFNQWIVLAILGAVIVLLNGIALKKQPNHLNT